MSLTNSIIRCQTNHYAVNNGILATTKRSKKFIHSGVISDFIAEIISGETALSTLTDLDNIDLISVCNHSSSAMTLSLDGTNYYVTIPAKDSCLLTLDNVASAMIKLNGTGFIEVVLEGTFIPRFSKTWDFEDNTLQGWRASSRAFGGVKSYSDETGLTDDGIADSLSPIAGSKSFEARVTSWDAEAYYLLNNTYSFPVIAGKPITVTMKVKSSLNPLTYPYDNNMGIAIIKNPVTAFNSYVQGTPSYFESRRWLNTRSPNYDTFTWTITATETTIGYLGIYIYARDYKYSYWALDDITISGFAE